MAGTDGVVPRLEALEIETDYLRGVIDRKL